MIDGMPVGVDQGMEQMLRKRVDDGKRVVVNGEETKDECKDVKDAEKQWW